MNLPIYMDNHATTPLDPSVLEAMIPYFTQHFGNAASNHSFGWVAEEAVEAARSEIAALINASPSEIVFTSGATESDNLAVKGVTDALRSKGNHIVTVATEHAAVLDPVRRMGDQGFEITVLPVDEDGLVAPEQVEEALRDSTVLVSVMMANNEIGVLQPVAEIGAICREHGVLFHTDAAQAFGKIPLDVEALNVDLASITSHKIYGPRGAAALFVRRRRPGGLKAVRLTPQMDGGGQERSLRSGTLNVPAIVGFAAAARLAHESMGEEAQRLLTMRERLRSLIQAGLDDVRLNGHAVNRLPGNLNIAFAGVEGESLLMGLRDIAISTGAACSSTVREPSHVLTAIGLDDELAFSSVRFGLGRFNTDEEVEYVGARVIDVIKHLRALGVPQPVAQA
ncbi:MAG: cysteine desulfurase [Armatimonadetes bacterium]|nr:cysteine desulfurase [Armatimonadota bacterium]